MQSVKEIIRNIIVANTNGKDIALPNQELYSVYGKELGVPNKNVKDFQEIYRNGEKFYPFLSANQYEGVTCYKLRDISKESIKVDMQPVY